MLPFVTTDVCEEYLSGVAALMKERASFISELLEDEYFFIQPETYDAKTIRKKWKGNTANIMSDLLLILNEIKEFNSANIQIIFKDFLSENNLKMGEVLPNFRLIVTGKAMGPSMFDIAELLGKEEVISRFNTGIDIIESKKIVSI